MFLSGSDNQYFRELNKIIFCLVFWICNFKAGFELNSVFVQQKPIFLLRQKRLSKRFGFCFFSKCWWAPSKVLRTQNTIFFQKQKMFSKAIYHDKTFQFLQIFIFFLKRYCFRSVFVFFWKSPKTHVRSSSKSVFQDEKLLKWNLPAFISRHLFCFES